MSRRRRRTVGRRVAPLGLTQHREGPPSRWPWGLALVMSGALHTVPMLASASGRQPVEPPRRLEMGFVEPPPPPPPPPPEPEPVMEAPAPAPKPLPPPRRRPRPKRSPRPPQPSPPSPPSPRSSPPAGPSPAPVEAPAPRRVAALSAVAGTLPAIRPVTGTPGGRGTRPGGGGRSSNQTALRIGQGDGRYTWTKPRRLSPARPAYPPDLRAQRVEGNVTVRVRLDASGRVLEASVVASDPPTVFDAAALASARAERFQPATRNGRPAPYTLTFTYRFRIED